MWGRREGGVWWTQGSGRREWGAPCHQRWGRREVGGPKNRCRREAEGVVEGEEVERSWWFVVLLEHIYNFVLF